MKKPRYHVTTSVRCVADAYSKTMHIAGYTQYIGIGATEPYHCSCDDFKVRRECAHMIKAVLAICAWNSMSGTPQTTPGVCPECYGPTREVPLIDEITVLH